MKKIIRCQKTIEFPTFSAGSESPGGHSLSKPCSSERWESSDGGEDGWVRITVVRLKVSGMIVAMMAVARMAVTRLTVSRMTVGRRMVKMIIIDSRTGQGLTVPQ